LAEFVSNYGVWLIAAFIALESIGVPLPAEAALIAAAFFAARTHDIDIWSLISAAIIAAILGEIAGFWIGRRFGHRLLMRYGARLGFTEERIRIGQWLFVRYGGRFVFIARFLPFLRNIAAVLAGTNSMGQHSFYFASATAAVAWIICYGLAAYSFGEAFANLASPVAVFLGLAATLIILAAPVLILRYERCLLAKADQTVPSSIATSNFVTVDGTGDFNHDGTPDILQHQINLGNGSETLRDLVMSPNAVQVQSATTMGTIGATWQVDGTGDFNHDGTADILDIRILLLPGQERSRCSQYRTMQL
jgi:membrane protein DedA with SNARE-associated domain